MWRTIAFLLIGCTTAPALQQGTAPSSNNTPLSASSRPGMGAIPYATGTMFRVWAPEAQRVWVAGDWNGWQPQELGNEFNGNFSGDFEGAQRWQKYKFAIDSKFGERVWRSDPRAYRVENSAGNAIIHDPGEFQWKHGFNMPGNNELVIYEMHIGSFNDAPGFGPGHFQSAEARLDQLADLGVNVVELLPVAEFPGDFSWGYNPAFPFAPEAAYGTPEDFKHFVDECHARNIGVIIDEVHNHYGPNDIPMWCFTGDCLGKGGAYFYTDARAQTPWGDTRPDYGRREVRDFVRDAVQYWLDEYHLDGIRLDGTKYMHTQDGGTFVIPDGYSLLQEITASVHAKTPWKLLIAEDFGAGDKVTSELGFNAQWDGVFVHPVRDAIIPSDDATRDMDAIRYALEHRFNGQATQRVIYTESHDEVANGRSRVPEEIWPGYADSWFSRKRSTLGAALLFTSPGIPMLFQGQEFLEDGYFQDSDPLDWSKAQSHDKIVRLYRDLAHLRRNWFNNTRGLRGDNVHVFHVNNTDKLLAYRRWDQGGPGDDVVVLANFSNRTFNDYNVAMPNWGLWRVRFNSDASIYSDDYANTQTFDVDATGPPRDGYGQSANLTIGPYSVVILSQ